MTQKTRYLWQMIELSLMFDGEDKTQTTTKHGTKQRRIRCLQNYRVLIVCIYIYM